jgi:hypothetical protein
VSPSLDNDPARLRLGGVFLSTPPSSSSVTLADPNMKMGGSVLSGARPPNSAKLIAPETEMWTKVVKLSGAKTPPMTALGQ